MSDAIERARELICTPLPTSARKRVALAALDCLEALRGDRWIDVECGIGETLTKPVDAHEAAWKRFEKVICGGK